MKVTTNTALEMAVKLTKEGKNFGQVAKILEEKGYKSERTGRPFKEMAVRYMVLQQTKADDEPTKTTHLSRFLDERNYTSREKQSSDTKVPNFTGEYECTVHHRNATADAAFEHERILSELAKSLGGEYTGGGMMVNDDEYWRDTELTFPDKAIANEFVSLASEVTECFTISLSPTEEE